MWRSHRRQELVRRWEAETLEPWLPAGTWPFDGSPRRRHRAPTPRLTVDRVWVASHGRPLAAFGATLGLMAAAVFALAAPPFRIREAAISGCQRSSAQEIYDVSGLDGVSIFRANRQLAEARLMALPDVQTARVRLALPNRLWIDIEEWQPLVIWSGPHGTLGVDARGRAMAPPNHGGDMVHVADQSGILTAPGEQLPTSLLEAALAYGRHHRQLTYRQDVGFAVQLDEGWPVWLGHSAVESERRLAMLHELRRELGRQSQPIEFLDLRFLDRPYFRLRTTEEEP